MPFRYVYCSSLSHISVLKEERVADREEYPNVYCLVLFLLLAEKDSQSIQGCNIEIDVLAAEEKKNSFAYARSFGDANAPCYSLLGTVRLTKEHIYRRRGLKYSRIMQNGSATKVGSHDL